MAQANRPVVQAVAALASRPAALAEGFRVARPGIRPGARPAVHPEEDQEGLLVDPVGAVPMGPEDQAGTLAEAQGVPDTLAAEAQEAPDTQVGGGPLAAPEEMGATRTLSWTGSWRL